MLALRGSTEKRLVPVARELTAATEKTLVPVALLKTVVVNWVCRVVCVVSLQNVSSVSSVGSLRQKFELTRSWFPPQWQSCC